MLLENISEPKQQFNVKLYCSMVKWIEDKAGEHATTSTNVVRHALNIVKDMSALSDELDDLYLKTNDYRMELLRKLWNELELDFDEYGIIIMPKYDETYGSIEDYDEFMNTKVNPALLDVNAKTDEYELKAGYAIREKYADVIQYIPQLPESPMPF